MTEAEARSILSVWLPESAEDGLEWCGGGGEVYVNWRLIDDFVTLDGTFTADELEAIAFWMRAKGGRIRGSSAGLAPEI